METAAATIVSPPFIILDAPIPATARPTISMREEFAAPHISDPSIYRPRNARYVDWFVPLVCFVSAVAEPGKRFAYFKRKSRVYLPGQRLNSTAFQESVMSVA